MRPGGTPGEMPAMSGFTSVPCGSLKKCPAIPVFDVSHACHPLLSEFVSPQDYKLTLMASQYTPNPGRREWVRQEKRGLKPTLRTSGVGGVHFFRIDA